MEGVLFILNMNVLPNINIHIYMDTKYIWIHLYQGQVIVVERSITICYQLELRRPSGGQGPKAPT
jgi:hypothetical protein